MVGVLICGTGDVSHKHYKAIKNTENGHLIGVYSRQPRRADEFAKLWHVKPYYSLETVLKDPEVDLVVICTSEDLHYEYAMKCAEAGKNFLVEKPPALTFEEIVNMYKACKRNNVTGIPVHNFIFRDEVMRAKKMIQDKYIGEPTYAFFSLIQRMPEERAKLYHGAFFTQAYHQTYLSNFLMGIPKKLAGMSAVFTYKEVKDEEVAAAMFKYSNGGIGHIIINWCINDYSTHSWMWLDKIIGTNGVITISTLDAYAEQPDLPYRAATVADYAQSFMNIHKHVIDDVLARKHAPIQTMYDAVVVIDILEKLKKSAKTGQLIEYEPPAV